MNNNNNLRGIVFMLAAMGCLALADALIKISTSMMSTAQVMFYLIAGALVIFALMAISQKEKLIDSRAFSPVLLVRYVAEVAGLAGMVTALAHVPISVVGAVTQASPILATVGAFLFLKEKVGWRRWSSIIIGFLGVLLIVQPGAIEFDFAVLWALLAMVALAIRDLTTRMMPSDMASTSLATFTMAAATPFTIAWVVYNGDSFIPEQINWTVVIPMVSFGAIGYLFLIASIRIAEVSVVMPFRYSRIIFLLVLGVLIFDEKPGALILLGAGFIIGSGMYMMWREQIVKRNTSNMISK